MNDSLKSFFCELFNLSLPVKGSVGKREIDLLVKKHCLDKASVGQGLLALSKILGPFDCLNEKIKQQFIAFSAHFFEEKEFRSNPIIQSIARGPIYRLSVKTIKTGWNVRKKNMLLSRLLIFTGRKVIRLLEGLAKKYLALSFMTGLYEAPIINILYRYCQLEQKTLIDEYVKNIPANPSSSPVFKVKKSKSRACALIGIDFLPSNGNLYFIESNFNPGHYIDRHLLSPDGDPVCRNLLNYAEEQGLNQILYYPTGFQKHFKGDVEAAWHEMARAKGFRIEIVDDAFLGSPFNRMVSADLNYSDENTLYVISRYFDNPLANFVVRKGFMEKNIAAYNEQVRQEERVHLPEAIDHESFLNVTASSYDRFPNVIVKNKYIDQAKGIHLFKTKTVPDVARNDDYMLCQYVIPDTIKKRGPWCNEGVCPPF